MHSIHTRMTGLHHLLTGGPRQPSVMAGHLSATALPGRCRPAAGKGARVAAIPSGAALSPVVVRAGR